MASLTSISQAFIHPNPLAEQAKKSALAVPTDQEGDDVRPLQQCGGLQTASEAALNMLMHWETLQGKELFNRSPYHCHFHLYSYNPP